MRRLLILSLAILTMSIGFGHSAASADAKEKFTQDYLDDPANFEKGKEIWFEQCTHCHGYKAYPGKAPKLKPSRYKPSFVYRRITKGFKKMPAWEDVYDKDERRAIVAYIMNKSFSP